MTSVKRKGVRAVILSNSIVSPFTKIVYKASSGKCQSQSCQFKLWSCQILHLEILIKDSEVLWVHAKCFLVL